MNRWYTVSVCMSLVVIVLLIGLNMMETEKVDDQMMLLKLELESMKIEQNTVEYLLDLVEDYQSEILRLQEALRLQEMLESIGIEVFETTAYAPLDPNAIEGMCYSGDPTITASGSKVEIGTTIAADTSILPFGSKVWIEGIGWREVQDRGGMIKGNRIDVAVQTRSEAFALGRDQRVVIYKIGG